MKKYLTAIVLLGGCLVANNALAREVSTIKQAKAMRDNAKVALEGKITGRAGDDDRYWLQDSTGKIRVDIDDDERGLVGKKVRVVGEVDKNDGRTEVDVDHLRVLN
jgi:uncharacterized protein (TIGR00156 family)